MSICFFLRLHTRYRFTSLIFVMALLAPRIAAAQTSSLTGTVTDGTSPLAGISVQLYNASEAKVAEVVTTSAGGYTLANLAAGTYYLMTFNTSGYVDQIYAENSAGAQANEDCAGCNPATGTPLMLAAGAARTGVDFVLRAGGGISGRVTSGPNGPALANVTVEIFNGNNRLVTAVTTDLDGRYQSARGLPAASYYVKASGATGMGDQLYKASPCLDCTATVGTPVVVVEPSTTTAIDFALTAAGTFSGTVTDASTGQPLGGVAIWLYNVAKRRVATALSGSDGRYVTGPLASGLGFYLRTDNALHYINAKFGVPSTCYGDCDVGDYPEGVPAGGTREINFELRPGGAFSGRITSGGTPLAGVTVEAVHSVGEVHDRTTTDSDGRYTTRAGLLAGSKVARTSNTAGYLNEVYDNVPCGNGSSSSSCSWYGTDIPIVVGTVTAGRDFDLAPGGRIAGQVTSAATGIGLPNVTVRVADQLPAADFTAVTDRNGRYLIPAPLRTGNYSVSTSNASFYLNQSRTVSVVTGATSQINLALLGGPETISVITGKVTSGTTPLIVNVEVYDNSDHRVAVTTTDASGTYTIGNLLLGTYFVRTVKDDAYFDEIYDGVVCNGCSPSKYGTPIIFTAAETKTINFDLARGNRIIASVDGTDVRLHVFDTAGHPVAEATRNSDGLHVAGPLPDGTYFVRTSNAWNAINEVYDNIVCFPNCDPTAGTPLTLANASDVTIAIALDSGTGVRGYVHGLDGKAILGDFKRGIWSTACVRIYDAAGVFIGTSCTDLSGAYETTRVPLLPGTYFARTTVPSDAAYANEVYDNIPCASNCDPTTGTPIVAAKGLPATVNFDLAFGGTIRGTVRMLAGTPVAASGVVVSLVTAQNAIVGTTTTGSDGRYALTRIAKGTYYVVTSNALGFINEVYDNVRCVGTCTSEFAKATPIAVSGVQEVPGIDFTLEPGARISGRVTNTAATPAPLADVEVRIYDIDARLSATARTASDGTYLSEAGVPSGRYVALTANLQGYIDEVYDNVSCGGAACRPDLPGARFIEATQGTTTPNINFALESGGRIHGAITGTTGTPVAGIMVLAQHTSSGIVSQAVASGDDGSYTIAGLPAGPYYVRTESPANAPVPYVNEVYDNIICVVCDPTAGKAVAVTLGSTTSGIDFVLERAGYITGFIRDETTLAGIPGAGANVYNSSGQFVASYPANTSGLYVAGGLATGTYYLKTTNSLGYVNELYDNIPCRETCVVTTGTAISVTQGTFAHNTDFDLAADGLVAGTVTDELTHQPIADVSVSVYDALNRPVASDGTDSNGRYSVRGVRPGSYVARTWNTSGYLDEASGAPLVVQVNTTTTADFALAPGARIAGTITAAAGGTPIAGVQVRVFDGTGTEVASGTSDQQGQYTTTTGLAAGAYFAATFNTAGYIDQIYALNSAGQRVREDCVGCDPTSGTPLLLSNGQLLTGIDFGLRAGGHISGRVTRSDGGTAVHDVTVEIFNATGRRVTAVVTNLEGRYQSDRGLAGGSYFVKAANGEGLAGELYRSLACGTCDATLGTPVVVTEGAPTANVDFALRAGGTFSGTVTDLGTASPIAGVNVWIYDEAKRRIDTSVTGADGTYTTGVLPAGDRFYLRTDNALHYVNQLHGAASACDGDCDVSAGVAVSVPAGGTATINFQLTLGGAFSGRITSGGSPLAGVTVQAVRPNQQVADSTTTDADGRYLTRAGLSAGDYYAHTVNTRGYIDEVYNDIQCRWALVYCLEGGTPIAISGDSVTTGRDFDLALGGRIAGTVTDAISGNAIANVTLRIVGGPALSDFFVVTDRLGRYASSVALLGGSYVVKTWKAPDLGYLDTDRIVTVVEGATTQTDFALVVGGQIAGTVTDAATGGGLPNVTVRVVRDEYPTADFRVVTDAAGRYATPRTLLSGSYRVSTTNTVGYLDAQQTVTVAESTVTQLDFPLVAGGRVSGVVRGLRSGAPLADALVVISLIGSTTVAPLVVTTNAEGRYLGIGLPLGRYVARAEATGYVVETAELLAVPTQTADVNFSLIKGGAITGVVRTADGTPLAGVQVFAARAAGATTDADGRYTLVSSSGSGLRPGSYYVYTQVPRDTLYIDEWYNDVKCPNCELAGDAVVVRDETTTSGVDFSLDVGGAISGRVSGLAQSGYELIGSIDVYTSDGVFVKSGAINSTEGWWSVSGLPSGSYFARAQNVEAWGESFPFHRNWHRIAQYADEIYNDTSCPYGQTCSVTSGTPIGVTAGTPTRDINFTLTTGQSIDGRVVDATTGEPIYGATIRIFDTFGRLVTTTTNNRLARPWDGTTYGQWVYWTQSLPAGTYFAQASAPGYLGQSYGGTWCFASCSPTAGTPIVLAPRVNSTGIAFSLSRGASLAGRVVEDTSAAAPLANITIAVLAPASDVVLATANTDGTGQFQVTGLASDLTYRVRTANTSGYVDEMYDNVVCLGDSRLCAGADVGAGAADVNFKLAVGARIEGAVTEDASATAVSATVLFFDAEGRRLAGAATTDADGHYRSPMALPDGTYYLATQNTRNYVDEAYGDYPCPQANCDVRRSTPVIIAGGQSVAHVDLQLARGGAITGQVVTHAGSGSTPLAGVRVHAHSATGLLVQTATTDSSKYELRGLPTGTYFVKTSNDLGFVDELYDDITCTLCDVTTGSTVAVAAGTSTSANFALVPGARLSGSVFDRATSQPLVDAGVIITTADGGAVRIVARVRTNAFGAYAVSLPAGSYYVQTDAIDGYATSIYHAPASAGGVSTVACPLGICGPETGTLIELPTGGLVGQIDLGLAVCPAIALSPARLPIGSAGIPYTQTLMATGGLAPYGFRVTDGALPPGLALDATGTLSGTTSAWGDARFTIAASDSNGCSGTRTYATGFCAITIDPTSASVSADGGSGALAVTATAGDCAWSATSDDSWLTVSPSSGTGSGTITYAYAARGVFSQPRSSTIGVGGHTFRLTQSGIAADYVVTPSTISLGPAAGVVRADITTNAPDAPWSVATDATWIEPAVEAGTGSSTIAFQVQRNATRSARAAQLAIAGRTLTITQRENGIPGLVERVDAQVFGGLARFNWIPPQRGGDATSYQFEAGLAPGATAAVMATPVPALTVPSVPPGRYFVRVRGQNEFGTGSPSDEYELVVGDDGTNPPGAPRNLVAAVTGARVTVTFDAPATGGVPRAYQLEAGHTPGSSDIGELQGTSRYLVYEEVPPGHYFMRVRGVNLAGAGEASNEVLVRVGDVPSPPDAPLTLSAAVAGHTVTLTAAPPTTGPPLTGYLLEVGFMRGHTDLVFTGDAAATAVAFENVPPGTYYLRLRATNAQGAGLASNEVRIDIP